MSIRWRLTIWYSVLMGVTVCLLGLGLYFNLRQELASEVDRSIAAKVQELLNTISITQLEGLPFPQVLLPNINVFSNPDMYLQVVDGEGRIRSRSENLGSQSLPVNEATLSQAARGQGFFEEAAAADLKLRIYNQPLLYRNRIIGVLQVGRSQQSIDLALDRLRLILLFGSILAIGLAAAGGWFMASAALRPLDRLAQGAEAIREADDLNRRLDYPGPPDEIGRLTETFNAMLGRLHSAYQRLAQAHQTQQQFVADASHELRTPLTSIRGNVEFLRKAKDAEPELREEALQDIAGEAERMSRLVNDLLALARADAGLVLEREPLVINDLLQEVVRSARYLTGEVDLISGDWTATENRLVSANPDYLNRLLLILLDNASKYTAAGGVVVVSTTRRDAELGVTVRDSGCGIPLEAQPHIFERFYRADASRSGGGTGLGLAIADWIAGQHDGRLEMTSRPGSGSVFTLWLPELLKNA